MEKWLPIASCVDNEESSAPIRIHADVNIDATILSKGKELAFEVGHGRQAYLVLIEGAAMIDTISLETRDALEIVEQDIIVQSLDATHILILEMKKG